MLVGQLQEQSVEGYPDLVSAWWPQVKMAGGHRWGWYWNEASEMPSHYNSSSWIYLSKSNKFGISILINGSDWLYWPLPTGTSCTSHLVTVIQLDVDSMFLTTVTTGLFTCCSCAFGRLNSCSICLQSWLSIKYFLILFLNLMLICFVRQFFNYMYVR